MVVKDKYDRYSPEATERRRISSRERVAKWRKENPEAYREQRLKWYEKNRERLKDYNAQWRKDNLDKWIGYSRKTLLKCQYGITEAEYQGILDKQGRKCGICGIGEFEVKKKLHIDHCHETGKVRGVLCNLCNAGLGQFRDDIALLQAAISYLAETR